MPRYTLHQETDDGTLEDAFHALSSKRMALYCARRCAKVAGPGVTRIIVCDAGEATVAAFRVPARADAA